MNLHGNLALGCKRTIIMKLNLLLLGAAFPRCAGGQEPGWDVPAGEGPSLHRGDTAGDWGQPGQRLGLPLWGRIPVVAREAVQLCTECSAITGEH